MMMITTFFSRVSALVNESIVKKVTIAFIAIIGIWNITKLPYYMSFGNDGNTSYNSHGIELSINLGHWVKGYRSKKMRTPPCNFLLVHASLGLTIVSMMILTLINQAWRKRYCKPFFIFAIIEGFHALPASWINDAGLTPLFLLACGLLIGMGYWGLKTNESYSKDPEKAEKEFLIQYSVITLVNCFAAFLETPNIIAAFKSKEATGTFHDYGDEPHKLFGHTIYDALPEKVGYTIFVLFTVSAWFIWPLLLLDIEVPLENERGIPKNEENIDETTQLVS